MVEPLDLISRDPDRVARGIMAVAAVAIIGAWLRPPAAAAAPPKAPPGPGALDRLRAALPSMGGGPFKAERLIAAAAVPPVYGRKMICVLVAAGEVIATGNTGTRRYWLPGQEVPAPALQTGPMARPASGPVSAPRAERVPPPPGTVPCNPVPDPDGRLVAAAIAAGRVTQCPPAYVAPVAGGQRLRSVPVYSGDEGNWKARQKIAAKALVGPKQETMKS